MKPDVDIERKKRVRSDELLIEMNCKLKYNTKTLEQERRKEKQ